MPSTSSGEAPHTVTKSFCQRESSSNILESSRQVETVAERPLREQKLRMCSWHS